MEVFEGVNNLLRDNTCTLFILKITFTQFCYKKYLYFYALIFFTKIQQEHLTLIKFLKYGKVFIL